MASSTLLANDVYTRFVAHRDHSGVGIDRLFTLIVGVVVLVISALVSDVIGALTVVVLLAWQGLLANSPIYGGLLVSLIVFVAVRLLTPRTSRETMSAWDRRVGWCAQRS